LKEGELLLPQHGVFWSAGAFRLVPKEAMKKMWINGESHSSTDLLTSVGELVFDMYQPAQVQWWLTALSAIVSPYAGGHATSSLVGLSPVVVAESTLDPGNVSWVSRLF
jgi:hypothetical protein